MKTQKQAKRLSQKRLNRQPLGHLIFYVRDEAKKRKFPKTAHVLDAAVSVLASEAEEKSFHVSINEPK